MTVGSFEFLGLSEQCELSEINKLLSVAGIQNELDGKISADQLDRRAAEQLALAEMANVLAKETNYDLAAGARIIHEAVRARRDINIAQATHKQLILGSYKTLYQRKLKLEKDLQEKRYV